MNWLTKLMRADLRELAAYSSARDEAEGFVPTIGIDANEFPWPPFGPVANLCKPNRYPEPQPEALLQRMAAMWHIPANRILLGRGSDEAIDLLLRVFCEAGKDRIIICPPTYGMYKVAASVQGAEVISVPLTKQFWQLDVAAISKSCTPNTKLIFIPSPHAPMGHMMRRDDIHALCMARAEQSLIVVDEAYIEFSDQTRGCLQDLDQYPNLVILRTLSKAHALAGERVGCAIALPDTIHALQKAMAPYPLTQSSIRAALDALSPNGLIQSRERRAVIIKERERMASLLKQAPDVTHIFPSVANFLLVQTKNSKDFMQRLKQFGILARDRHKDIPDTVRLAIGTPEENDLVLKALGVAVEKPLNAGQRLASVQRKTKETAIDVTVNLDAPNFLTVETGIGFFNHMLAQLASHGGFGLELHCKGDLEIDQHHTIEDCALALGEALKNALGDKRGVARFGFQAPLDEALANVTVDLSGRPYFVFTGKLPADKVGEMSGEMVPHFFRSLATALHAAIHVTVTGDNAHHMVEASFKATGRALRQAFQRESDHIPSTKGVL